MERVIKLLKRQAIALLGRKSEDCNNTSSSSDEQIFLVRMTVPGLNCSAVILVIQIPMPSINANKTAPTAADLTAAEGPPDSEETKINI